MHHHDGCPIFYPPLTDKQTETPDPGTTLTHPHRKELLFFDIKPINSDVDFRCGQSLSAGNASASSEVKPLPAGSDLINRKLL